VVAVHAGLRPGELLALRWEDVDLERCVLHVRRALSDGKFAAPKEDRSERRERGRPQEAPRASSRSAWRGPGCGKIRG
jgi:integrase